MDTNNLLLKLNVDPKSSLFNILKNSFTIESNLKCAKFFIGDETNYIINALVYNLTANYTIICEQNSQTQKILQILFSLNESSFSIQEKQKLSQVFNISIKDPEFYLKKFWVI